MPLSRKKIWSDHEVPTALQLNDEFDNICSKFSSNITVGDIDITTLPELDRFINAGNYPSIADAITAAAAAGKHVWIPAGTYNESVSLSIPNNMHIVGAGVTRVTIKPSDGFTAAALFSIGGSAVNDGRNVRLSGFTIQEPANYAGSVSEFSAIQVMSEITLASEINNIVIDNVNIDMSTVSTAMSKKCIKLISNTMILNFIIDSCEFVMDNPYDPYVTAYRRVAIATWATANTVIRNCVFTGGNAQVDQEASLGAAYGTIHIHNCIFTSSTKCAYNIRTDGGSIIENNLFYLPTADPNISTHIVTGARYLQAASKVQQNVFSCTPNDVNMHCIIVYDGPTTVINNSTSGAGYYRYFLWPSVGGDTWWSNNSTHASTTYVYAGGSVIERSQIASKTYNSAEMLKIGDVYIWLHYAGTTNYLRFKQGAAPTAANDDHARIALTGTVNIAD